MARASGLFDKDATTGLPALVVAGSILLVGLALLAAALLTKRRRAAERRQLEVPEFSAEEFRKFVDEQAWMGQQLARPAHSGPPSGATPAYPGPASGATPAFPGPASGSTRAYAGPPSGATPSYAGPPSGATPVFPGQATGGTPAYSGPPSGPHSVPPPGLQVVPMDGVTAPRQYPQFNPPDGSGAERDEPRKPSRKERRAARKGSGPEDARPDKPSHRTPPPDRPAKRGKAAANGQSPEA